LSLGEQNSQVASLWREMDNEDKCPYYELCKGIKTHEQENLDTPRLSTWNEAKCVMDNMQHYVSNAHIKTTPMVL